jgi:predicted dinucleotide-binding enzyme
MRIAVLGTDMVGDTIASKLVKVGHRSMGGSRTADRDAGQAWLRRVGGQGQIGTFAAAAAFGEIVFDCTNGAHTLAALRQAGVANPRGKILIQVGSNPLDTYHQCLNRQSVAKRSRTRRMAMRGVSRAMRLGAATCTLALAAFAPSPGYAQQASPPGQ